MKQSEPVRLRGGKLPPEKDLRKRTKLFAIRIVRLCRSLPNNREGRLIAHQLFRAGTAVAANYRAACRSRSTKEFVAKLGIVEEEADESLFWMELLKELAIVGPHLIDDLMTENNELLSIMVASKKTARTKVRGK